VPEEVQRNIGNFKMKKLRTQHENDVLHRNLTNDGTVQIPYHETLKIKEGVVL